MALSNVVKTDIGAILTFLHLHCETASPIILDATYHKGRIWRKSPVMPSIKIDIDPQCAGTVKMDNTKLAFASKSIDVIVYDPPHLPDHGNNSTTSFNDNYGLRGVSSQNTNVNHLFSPFFSPAGRVLVEKGIILAKISHMVHNHKYQAQDIAMITDALSCGFTFCDRIFKIRNPGPISGKWQNQYHTRNAMSHWLCFRKGKSCERTTKVSAFPLYTEYIK